MLNFFDQKVDTPLLVQTANIKLVAPKLKDKMVIDRIHGWGDDYEETRYNGIVTPLVISGICVAIFIWGLQPW